MNPVGVTGRLEREIKARDTARVGTLKHLQFQLYLELLRHLGHLACPVVIEMLGLDGQAITAVAQGCSVVCIDAVDGNYGLFQRMVTPVVTHIDRMTTAIAPTLRILAESSLRFLIPCFPYRFLAADVTG